MDRTWLLLMVPLQLVPPSDAVSLQGLFGELGNLELIV
jgi:hypothetical protein